MEQEMPLELVMVRHGYSEANHIQKGFKTDPNFVAPSEFFERHDVSMRLAPLGVEQAKVTGEWLNNEYPAGFHRYYVSPLIRAIETAGALGLVSAKWRQDDRLRERDWGEYASLTDAEAAEKYTRSRMLRKQHKWYWCPAGGESLATGVRFRFESILNHMSRETPGKSNVIVSHGELMEVATVLLERLTPDEWLERNRDPGFDMGNCQIIHYTRKDPETGVITPDLRWRRALNIWDNSKSWNDGEWTELKPRKLYTNEELIALAEKVGRLFDPQIDESSHTEVGGNV